MDPLPQLTVERWAELFRGHRGIGIEAIIDYGRCLIDGKAFLGHGRFEEAIKLADIGKQEAEQCMRIARHPVLSNPCNYTVLPSARSSLNLLAGLQNAAMVDELITAKVVTPNVTTKELREAVNGPPEPKRWSTPSAGITKVVTDFFGGTLDMMIDAKELLTQEWSGQVFVNPPKVGEPDITRSWVVKTKGEWRSGRGQGGDPRLARRHLDRLVLGSRQRAWAGALPTRQVRQEHRYCLSR